MLEELVRVVVMCIARAGNIDLRVLFVRVARVLAVPVLAAAIRIVWAGMLVLVRVVAAAVLVLLRLVCSVRVAVLVCAIVRVAMLAASVRVAVGTPSVRMRVSTQWEKAHEVH